MYSKRLVRLLALLVMSVVCLAAPAPAAASSYSSFVKFLAANACRQLSDAGKSGCYAYLEARILKCSSPSEALAKGKARCDSWSDIKADSVKREQCYGGCQFLRNKE